METGRKWAAVAAIDSIVLHAFSGIRKFTQNIVNTFARTNVYVSAPFLRRRHRWCRFIVFTSSFSSVCAINQCLFGHRLRRVTIMHSFSFAARHCRYLFRANSFVDPNIWMCDSQASCTHWFPSSSLSRSECVWHFVLFSFFVAVSGAVDSHRIRKQ